MFCIGFKINKLIKIAHLMHRDAQFLLICD